MIEYRSEEEKFVALYFADVLNDAEAKRILESGVVSSPQQATHLSKFFWSMINKSAEGDVKLPCDGSSQYWTEKLYNSIGGYLEKAGYENEWNEEVDKA